MWEKGRFCQTSKNKLPRDPTQFIDTSGKNKLNRNLLLLISIAVKRIRSYLEKYYFCDDEELNQLYRPPREVNLRRVVTLAKEMEGEDKKSKYGNSLLMATN